MTLLMNALAFGLVLISLLAAALPARAADDEFPFTLPWDDASPSITNVSHLLHRPAGKHGFVTAKNGKLVTKDGRIRFLGVNICMSACFPEHAQAEKMAARLAKFGINAVRFHHMDYAPAPTGILKADQRTLDPGQMDRLDYFIARLIENGIYIDLNLHVSRVYPGLPSWDGMPSFFKGVDHFEPRAREMQREFARDLLTHRNPYTGRRYVEEPAVAFVEINNENGLIYEWSTGSLDGMPAALSGELGRQWNAWLGRKYASLDARRKAWTEKEEPLGAEMLKNAGFAAGTEGWTLEVRGRAKASVAAVSEGPDGASAARVTVEEPGLETWHAQIHQAGLDLRAGRTYTLTFRARSETPRTMTVNTMAAVEPWNTLWSATNVAVGPDWQSYRFVFRPAASASNGRVTFSDLAGRTGSIWLADVSLRPGSPPVEPAAEQAPVIRKADFRARSLAEQRDWVAFLWDTEERYWLEMDRFLKKDLGAKSLVIGTQTWCSPPALQAKLDVVDSHHYWKHPAFPGAAWDGENWFVENVPMAGMPTTGTLAQLMGARIAGKPYVVTEYNHPAPNEYGAEMMPLLCAYAAYQDWDGVFAFDYVSNKDLIEAGRIGGFFSIANHSAKMATLPAAAAMFLRGDVKPGAAPVYGTTSRVQAEEDILRAGAMPQDSETFGLATVQGLRTRTGLKATTGARAVPLKASEPEWPLVNDTGELTWDAREGRRCVVVNTPRTKAVIGSPEGGRISLDGVVIQTQGWSVIALTALEENFFRGPGRHLLTAVRDAWNTGRVWKDEAHTSVGNRWGTAPVLAQGVTASVLFTQPRGKVRVWSLNEQGQRMAELPGSDIAVTPSGVSFPISPEHRTVWYEIEIR